MRNQQSGQPSSMRLAQLQRPLRSVAVGPCIPPLRPVTTLLCCRLGPNANNSFVDGRRFASVKAQGAYKVSNSKRPMKKMGAKRVGGMSLLPFLFGTVKGRPVDSDHPIPEGSIVISLACHAIQHEHRQLTIMASIIRSVCHPGQHHLQAARHRLASW